MRGSSSSIERNGCPKRKAPQASEAAAPEGEHRGTLSAKVRGKPYGRRKSNPRAKRETIYLLGTYIAVSGRNVRAATDAAGHRLTRR
jgi:hypothetical protein